MAKYRIQNLNELIKILKIQMIKNNFENIEYDELFCIINSKDIKRMLKILKKLNIKIFLEE